MKKTWLKQHGRGICRAVGIVLLGTGMFTGYWWFYKLAPGRRTVDPAWYAAHSQRAYWHEQQKKIYRGMWFHDDGLTIGLYADKSMAQWIMEHVKPGGGMGCWGDKLCHSANAMREITNQDVGDRTDAWLAWWETNKAKTQEEWIKDGFRQWGVDIDAPPAPPQIPILLTQLGHSKTNAPTAVPWHIKFNAFRFLRDSGFEPVGFAISNQNLSADVAAGLLKYAQMVRSLPAESEIGILAFGKKDQKLGHEHLHPMVMTRFQVIAYALVFGPLLLGAGLLMWSARKKKEESAP